MASWYELTFEVSADRAEAIVEALFDRGCAGVEEQGRDGAVLLRAYFTREISESDLRRDLSAAGVHGEIETREIADQDWANNWRDHFVPLTVGTSLFVCPPWTAERPAGRHSIVIDPGMAFGTGQHATTRMCLELCEAAAGSKIPDYAVDLGCGSGILAIALAKLGAAQVAAVEIDPVALEAAVENARCNDVADRFVPLETFDAVTRPAQLLVANLFTNLLVELAPRIAQAVVPGGRVICAGFIESDAAIVERAMSSAGLRRVDRRDLEGWTALAFDRPA